MKSLHIISFSLILAGALNWLLVGLFGFNLVEYIFTDILGVAMLTKVVYVLVGLGGIYELATHRANCRMCRGEGGAVMSAAM